MADEAGPSGTGTGRLSDEKLAEVESDFQKGVQCIKVRQNGTLAILGLGFLILNSKSCSHFYAG